MRPQTELNFIAVLFYMVYGLSLGVLTGWLIWGL